MGALVIGVGLEIGSLPKMNQAAALERAFGRTRYAESVSLWRIMSEA